MIRPHSVVVTNAQTDLGRAVCAALQRTGAQVTPQRGSSGESAQQLVEDAVNAFGCLDAFVNCPALQPEQCGPAESLALDAFAGGVSANLTDAFFGCQAAAAQMLDQACPHASTDNRGCIVNITSVAGVLALPGHAAFCSAMAGLKAITSVLAAEWGPRGIRVAAVGAGLSEPLIAGLPPAGASARRLPPHAVINPEQVAETVCFLLGEAAQAVAGSTLWVDGGWLADGYWE